MRGCSDAMETMMPGIPMSSMPSRRMAGTRRNDAPAAIGRASADARWPRVAQALDRLRAAKRRSVRIVDADCGSGELLLDALRYARSIGFTAIEGRGIDGVPSLVRRARSQAAHLHDPAIGVTYEVADVATAMAEEAGFPADIVLWKLGRGGDPTLSAAVAAAAALVIADGDPALAMSECGA